MTSFPVPVGPCINTVTSVLATFLHKFNKLFVFGSENEYLFLETVLNNNSYIEVLKFLKVKFRYDPPSSESTK